MYALWGSQVKKLNKIVKRWITMEKENEESEIYLDLIELKRECVVPVLRLY